VRAGLALAAALALSLAGGLGAAPPPQDPPPAGPSFEEFLAGVRRDALAAGIRQTTLDAALAGLEPNPVVIARDRAQPELTQSLDDYVATRLTPARIESARTLLKTHGEVLGRVEQAYGVQAPMMVALWGLESNFGQFTGTYPTIGALATLAYDGRRAIFRDELMAAIAIVDKGQASPDDLKGSWAGAMGQPQFMPSSYLRHAVDFDSDGRADIWASLPDVFGSMANYLKNSDWRAGERWGREVRVTRTVLDRIERAVPMRAKGCRAIRELTVTRPLSEWATLGVRLANGNALPNGPTPASLVRGQARHFLVYHNFESILAYNCSNSYAVSVGLLADAAGK
jgi:membrane-bound lytic murein transglycosylase B